MTDYMQNARELTEAEPLQNSDWSLERVYRRVLARTLEALDTERAAHEATKAECLEWSKAFRDEAERRKQSEAELQALRDMLVSEREDNLWNSYATGSEADGIWTHMSMSDGEDLVRQCGLDVKARYYDAAIIKAKIPIAARTDATPTCWLYRNSEGHTCVQFVQGLMDLKHWTETPLYPDPPASDVAALVEAAKAFQHYGCPVCSGDCGSANPPVMNCPMQALSAALAPFTKGQNDD